MAFDTNALRSRYNKGFNFKLFDSPFRKRIIEPKETLLMKIKFILAIFCIFIAVSYESASQQVSTFDFLSDYWICLDTTARWDDSIGIRELSLGSPGKK